MTNGIINAIKELMGEKRVVRSISEAFGFSSARFLSLIVEREGLAADFCSILESRSADRGLAYTFHRLAEEEKRHQTIAMNHYELETLGTG